jgi:DUF1680 family protein
MDRTFTRRNFLGTAAAVSASPLLPAGSLPRSQTVHPAVKPAVTPVPSMAQAFPLAQVRLMPSFWKDMMELNRSFLYSLPNDRLAHNFRVTAGLPSEADPLGGWEAPDCELRGHYVGHYLSACAMLHASTGDEPVAAKANDLVAILAACQTKDGYVGAYPASFYERLRTYQPIWAPFYTYHKILAGLLDMYQLTGNQQALSVAVRMADWADAYSRLIISAPGGEDAWQKVLLVEHGGMNEAAFNLYAITGHTKYRDLGYRFEHKKFFEPLAANEDKLAGNHANTNIPKVVGAIRGYELTGDQRYAAIAENFQRIVMEHHVYCTGGTSDNESWHAPDAVAAQLGPSAEECCCSYNMMKLTRHLFARQPDAKHFDYYERLLLNVRYGTQDRNGMLMYYVSLKPGMYKTFGTPFDAFWCCTGTGSEEYAKLTDSIYFHDEDSVFVNLYIASRLDWQERGFQLRQTTRFPNEERISFTVDRASEKAVALKLRIPYWATKGFAVTVNGVPQQLSANPSSYLTLAHAWKQGDIITLDLPMTMHFHAAPDDKQVQVAMYGPLVLAARLGTEGLTNGMIYGGEGPRGNDAGYPMPTVNAEEPESKQAAPVVWLERVEASKRYPLQFRTLGRGPIHTLVPLNQIMDERYSVYLRNQAAT